MFVWVDCDVCCLWFYVGVKVGVMVKFDCGCFCKIFVVLVEQMDVVVDVVIYYKIVFIRLLCDVVIVVGNGQSLMLMVIVCVYCVVEDVLD